MRHAIYLMVGPGHAEAKRLQTLLAGLFRHEPATPLLVIVNDSGGPLPALDAVVPSTCEVVALASTRKPDGHGHTRNILKALGYLAARDDWDFAFKLDTDALVIAPFTAKVGRYLQAHPDVGQVGKTDRDCDGRPVSFGVYTLFARRLSRRIQIWKSPHWGAAQAFLGTRAHIRELLRQAAANGAPDGLHCQGGAYAVTRIVIQRLAKDGLLAEEPFGTIFGIGDDLLISVLVAAYGYKLGSMVATNEPFALEAKGLSMPPADLAARGYSLIHSIKNDNRFSEAEIVAYFEPRDVPAAVQK